jgi:hypothetical protein
MMLVDCRKTRAAAKEWKKKPGNSQWKMLGIPSNQRQRITGTVKGALDDFAKVERDKVVLFAEQCGCQWQDFAADKDAYEKWRSERKQRNSATETASVAQHVEGASLASHAGDGASQPAKPQDPLGALHKRLSGYYEVYHYATSKRRKRAVSVFLLHVQGINKSQGVIQCEIHDNNLTRPYFHQRGHITPIGGFLYWELRPEQQDAICYCCSYIPSGEKYPGFTLYGIFLTTSGDETREYPIAAKAALRFLGETPSDAVQNSVVDLKEADGEPEHLLRTRVGGYLSDLEKDRLLRVEVLKLINTTIIPRIDNEISSGATPFALRMPR